MSALRTDMYAELGLELGWGDDDDGTRDLKNDIVSALAPFAERAEVDREAARAELVALQQHLPPDGWFPFGSHAGMTHCPPMDFSTEVGEDGLPLWERVDESWANDGVELAALRQRVGVALKRSTADAYRLGAQGTVDLVRAALAGPAPAKETR